jgi:metallo-beta-lactamase class B
MKALRFMLLSAVLAMPALPLGAQAAGGYTNEQCSSCAEWNAPRRPLRIYGNTYYVGTQGLSAILVTSRQGHVLIDGALPESAPHILANIRALGFRVQDIKLILNSHPHFDHSGGIAALQRASSAVVAASPASAPVLERGASGPDDPQYGPGLLAFPAVSRVRVIADGDTVRVGPLALTAHFTPGHTPGGTSWSWRSCERGRCLEMVYADSQSPISAEGFRFTSSQTYPSVLADFERGFAVLERLRCDVLLTPHPEGSRLWERIAERDLVDGEACRRYAATARERLARRVASEREAQR